MQVGDSIDVLDHGFVRLDGCMADDLSVVNGARVSFASRVEEMTEREEGLIRFLMRERHGTPFEHNSFRFHVKCPIFVAREWMRHRTNSFNEWSGRYSKLEAEFYVPAAEDVRTQVGKPGSYTFDPVERRACRGDARGAARCLQAGVRDVRAACSQQGVAKEIARNVLPVAIYTQFYWTVNARSLMNFLSLRNAETAQREIRRYAEAVERFFAGAMPVTHAAFVGNERRAP